MSRKFPNADRRWPVCRTVDLNQPTPDSATLPAPANSARRKRTTARLGQRDDRSHATAAVQPRTSHRLDDMPTAGSEPLGSQQDVQISGKSPNPGRRRRHRRQRERLTKVGESTRVRLNTATAIVTDQTSGDTCRMDNNKNSVMSTVLQNDATVYMDSNQPNTNVCNPAKAMLTLLTNLRLLHQRMTNS